jgi:hypothetical protein
MFCKRRNALGASLEIGYVSSRADWSQIEGRSQIGYVLQMHKMRYALHTNWLCSEKTTGPQPTLV